MNLSIIIGASLFLAGIYLWRKYNDQEFFWWLFPTGGLILLDLLEYVSKTFLQLTDNQQTLEFYVIFALRIIAGIAIAIIIVKYSVSREKRSR